MTLPMEPEQNSRPLNALALGAAGVGLLGAVAWYFLQSPPATTSATPSPEAQPAAATNASAAAPVVPAAATAAAPPAQGDDLAALQFRLDAFARAYNEGNVAGLERVLWQNHAVVRPTGETMYRSDLIGQWTREWSELGNRELSFVVESVSREGDKLTAVWDLTLLGDVTDDKGVVHKMEINGSQKASYTVAGADWILEGPIVYVGFERTIDGDPWPVGQNGR